MEKQITKIITQSSQNANIGISKGKEFSYSLDNLKKHFIALGSSGSGKTVLTKILIEECALRKIPSIVVDVQGDLCSLAILGDKKEILSKGLSEENYTRYEEEVEVTIFTPISTKGIPICINPLKITDLNLPEEEIIPILHSIANAISKLLGYNTLNDKGKSAEAILYTILKNSYETKNQIDSFENLAYLIQTIDENLRKEISDFFSDEKELENLVKKIKFMGVGEKKLIFQFGVPVNIDLLIGKGEYKTNKTKISVIYLNTFTNHDDKEFFLTNLTTELYQWMLDNPSDSLQCAYVIDEIAPFLPAGSEKPMPKTILKLLFKQARKYGIGCLIATQNPGDIDYKAFSQFGTWAIGRLSVKQDLKKVETALKTLSGNVDYSDKLPKLLPGEFLLFAPDISKDLLQFKSRWLYTKHQTLNDDDIKELMEDRQDEFQDLFVKESQKVFVKKEEITNTITEENTEKLVKKLDSKDEENKKTHKFFKSLNYEQAIAMALKKRRRMFFFFGPYLEKIGEVKEILQPYIYTKVKVREKNWFGFPKKELSHYIVLFDGKKGSIIKAKSSKHKEFELVSKLIQLNDNQISVAKSIIGKRKSLSIAEIVHKTHLSKQTVSSSLKKLEELSIITEKKIDTYTQYYTLNPFKIKKINQIASKTDLFTRKETSEKLPKVNIETKDLARFVQYWFEDSQIEEKETLYLPMYKAVFLKKNSTRTIMINGATKKYVTVFD
jgi:predicted transcriptional regulator